MLNTNNNINDISSSSLNNLIWLDLEMTGLNPDYHHILEMSIIITDQNLNIISDIFDLVIYQPPENLNLMNNLVKEMHTKNGLIVLSRNSKITIDHAEILALEFVSKYVPRQISPLCGNSICLDRRFLFRYMPRLESYFHYRNLDVSTLKNLGIYWFPEKIKTLQKIDSNHRAKEDILQSIQELIFYKENFFK